MTDVTKPTKHKLKPHLVEIVKVTVDNPEDIKRWLRGVKVTTARNMGTVVLFEWHIDYRQDSISALIGEYLVKNLLTGEVKVIDKDEYVRDYDMYVEEVENG